MQLLFASNYRSDAHVVHTLPVPLSGQVPQKLLHYKQVVPDKYIPFGLSHVKQSELDEHVRQGAVQAIQVVIPSQ